MAKHTARSTKPGKVEPNDGRGGLISSTDGGKQPIKDSVEPSKPITAGPHPPSPPESPKQQKLPLSGPRIGSAGLSNLNTNINAGRTSMGATGAPTSATAVPSVRDPTAVAVSDLLGTMQNTLTSLGMTFDVLGEQTLRVASLGPAVDALSQIECVQRELDEKTKYQEARMQNIREKHVETAKAHFRENLRPRVNEIVTSCVAKEIEDRVRRQLTVQIPAALREELLQYRLQIMEARRDLHNSEARRHNALIRSSGLDEPLKPLLRPLQPSVEQDVNADLDGTPDSSGGTNKGKKDRNEKGKNEGKGKGKNKDDTTGILTPPSTVGSVASATTSRTARPGAAGSGLSLNTAVSPCTNVAVTAFQGWPASALSAAGVDLAGLGRWDIVPPTPSPHFPSNLATLVSLTADKARALVREYGLVRDDDEREDQDENTGSSAGMVRGGKQGGNARGGRGGVGRGGRTQRPASMATTCSDASSWVNAGLDGTREDDLNKFMRYIGVGFQLLPSSPIAVGGGTGMMLQSPVVERRDCSFIR